MEKKKKRIFGLFIVLGGAVLLSSCNSFCSDVDKSNYLYSLDPINTTFFDSVQHGEDYIKSTFAKQSNFDTSKELDLSNVRIKKLNEETNTIEEVNYDANLVFEKVNDGLYKINPVDMVAKSASKADSNNNRSDITYTFGLNDFTKSLIANAQASGIITPTYEYFKAIDEKTLEVMESNAKDYSWLSGITLENITYNQMYGYSYTDLEEFRKDESNKELLDSMLEGDIQNGVPSSTNPGRNYSFLVTLGHVKFYNSDEPASYYSTVKQWTDELVKDGVITGNDIPSINFQNYYEQTLNSKVNTFKTCITVDDGFYGHISNDPLNDTILIQGKAENFYEGWGKAFSEHGFLEGLLVYPIGTLVENLSHAFGMNGYGQIGAVLITTMIVRLLFMLITLPSTLSQQKMTFIQPELAKIQQKYPNANTNQYEKQKLAQAQMALYKKYKIHPFGSIIVICIQFPLFISVWNAFSGSASLSRDAVLGLRLSDTIWSALTNFSGWPSTPGWWTALVLIILMSAGQIMSMFIPQWLNKKRTKNVTKVGVNPALDKQNKTMKITSWVMTIMIILMGFTLPSALGVYWLAGAIFSIIQSLIMHFVFVKKAKKGQL